MNTRRKRTIGRITLGIGVALLAAAVVVKATIAAFGGAAAKPEVAATGKLPAIFNALPADTIAAIALTDLDKFRADLKGTALGEVWNDPNLKVWREQSWPKWKAFFAQLAGVTADEIDGLIHGDALFLITMPDRSKRPTGEPGAAFLFRPSTNKAELEGFVKKILAKGGAAGVPVKWAGDVLIIADGEKRAAELEANLKAGRSPLAGSKAFDLLQNSYAAQGFLYAFVSVENIMRWAADQAPQANRAKTDAVIKAVGLSNFSAAYLSSAIQKKGFVTNFRAKFDGSRQGVFTLFGENAPSKAIRLMSPDVQTFFTLRHAGMDKIFSTIRGIVMATGEVDEQDWKQGLAQINEQLGINIESDLPKLIGKELAFSTTGFNLMAQINLFIESPDPAGLMNLADKLLQQAGVQTMPAEQQGIKYKYFAIPQPLPLQIAFGPVGDFLVVSTQQAGIAGAATALSTKKSLADTPAYAQAMAEAGQPGFGESYSMMGKDIASLMAMSGPFLIQGLNSQFKTQFTVADIPNLQALIDHASPSVSRIRTTADAIESQGYATVGGGLDPAMVGVLAAIATPNFLEAQMRSKVSRARSDMRSLAVCCEAYFVDNNFYPEWTIGGKETGGKRSYNYWAVTSHGGSGSPADLPSFQMHGITTPIAYLTGFMKDPYSPAKDATYVYWSIMPGKPDPSGKIVSKDSKGIGWILISPGPDGDYDLAGEWDVYDPSVAQPSPRLLGGTNKNGSAYTYDPTNGTRSNGDIWRVK